MAGRAPRKPPAIVAYFTKVPPLQRPLLERLRRTILSAAPGAEEVLSYGIPAVRRGRVLVYYAGFRDHLSFFPGSAAVRTRFAAELRPWAGGKGTVRFTAERPLPDGLVRRIVRARVSEEAARVAARPPRRRTRPTRRR